MLKVEYRLKNLSTMVQLVRALDKSKHVTIHTSATSDFVDWNYFLDLFYHDFTKAGVGGLIKSNHIFSCNFQENRQGNNVHVHIRESDLPEHVVYKHKTIKSGFFGRSDFPKTSSGLRDAIAARKDIIKKAMTENLMMLENNGINIFKRVELETKYKKIIPLEDQADILYELPPPEVIAAVKAEKSKRKVFREEIHADKKKVTNKLEGNE